MATNGSNEAPESRPNPPQDWQAGGGGGGVFGISTKWLIIGGGGAGAVLVAAVIAVILFIVLPGGTPQPGSTMDLVPDDASGVVIFNIKAALADDYLADQMEDNAKFSAGTEALADVGIDAEDIEQLISASAGGGLFVVKADFDPGDVQDALEDDDAEEDDYRGYSLWEFSDGRYGAILDGGYIVGGAEGAVKDALNNLYRGEGALSNADDDSDLKRVLDKVGDGIVIIADVGETCSSRLERCEGYGVALKEVDEDGERGIIKYVALFRNERSAENAEEDYDGLADFFEILDLDVDDAEVDGEFVTGNATADYGETSRQPAQQQPTVDVQATIDARWAAVPAATQAPAAATTEAPAPVRATNTPSPINDWVDDCEWDYSSEQCLCMYDAVAEVIPPGVEIPDYDSSDWDSDDFALAMDYALLSCG